MKARTRQDVLFGNVCRADVPLWLDALNRFLLLYLVPVLSSCGDSVFGGGSQLEELGLLKMDYLGLRTLTIIDRCVRNIEKLGGTPPDLEDLPMSDPRTYELLMAGDTLGVFQLESRRAESFRILWWSSTRGTRPGGHRPLVWMCRPAASMPRMKP